MNNNLKDNLKKLLEKEMTRKNFLRLGAVFTISVIGIGGIISELLAHAATPYVSEEAEGGTLGGNATIGSDTNASGGKYVKFGTSKTTTTGDYLTRLGMYNGDINGDSLGAGAQVGILGGSTPPLYSSYPWGCTGAINQGSGQNGIAAICTDASSRGLKCMIGFPMCGGVDGCTISFAQVAAGDRDADAAYFAGQLVANGCPDAMVRMGWEGNQANAASDPAGYVAAVQRLVPIMKAVAPEMQAVWNPTMNSGQLATNLELQYPGDSVIDLICLDFYDNYMYTTAGGPGAPGSAYPGIAVTWPYYLAFPAQGGTNNGTGLNWLSTFGAAHNKPIGFCECGLGYNSTYGVGGGDNPAFENMLAQWVMSNPNGATVKVVTLWNSGGQGFLADNGDNVNSLAALVSDLTLT